jgi:hypothetical protein
MAAISLSVNESGIGVSSAELLAVVCSLLRPGVLPDLELEPELVAPVGTGGLLFEDRARVLLLLVELLAPTSLLRVVELELSARVVVSTNSSEFSAIPDVSEPSSSSSSSKASG